MIWGAYYELSEQTHALKGFTFARVDQKKCGVKHMATKTVQQKEATEAFRKLVIEKQQRIIRKRELLGMVGLSDATIWRMEKDGKFPKRLRLGGNSCGWFETEVMDWMAGLAVAREA